MIVKPTKQLGDLATDRAELMILLCAKYQILLKPSKKPGGINFRCVRQPPRSVKELAEEHAELLSECRDHSESVRRFLVDGLPDQSRVRDLA